MSGARKPDRRPAPHVPPGPREEPAPVSILLFDDHANAGAALKGLFAPAHDILWLGQVRSAEELETALAGPRPDVVLLDWHLQDTDTVTLLRQLVRRHEGLRFVVISTHLVAAQVKRCLYAGSRGYLYKGAPPEALAEQVRQVAKGRVVLSAEVQSELADT